MPLFAPITKDQFHVNNPARMAEYTGQAIDTALRERGPVQLNIPRDFFYGESKLTIPRPQNTQEMRCAGNEAALDRAAAALAGAKNPVILAGGGVAMAEGGVEAARHLAEVSFPQCHLISCLRFATVWPARPACLGI